MAPDAALEALQAAWTRARAGDGRALHLCGAPATGKSALIQQFIARAEGPLDDVVVLRAWCGGEQTDQPGRRRGRLEGLIAKIAEGVRAVTASEQPGWMLPSDAYISSALALADVPVRVARARVFADLLLSVTRHHAVLMVLEDVEAADLRSRAIIEALCEALANGGAGRRLLLVLVGVEAVDDPQCPADAVRWLPLAPRITLAGEGVGIPPLLAAQYADLRVLALAGAASTPLMARIWRVSEAAARVRLAALVGKASVAAQGHRHQVTSAGIAAHLAHTCDAAQRAHIEVSIGHALRKTADAQLSQINAPMLLDVTVTWREGRNTEARLNAALDALWRAIGHFARGGQGLEAADAAIDFVEGALTHNALAPMIGGPAIRLADRARRRQLSAALMEARFELDATRDDPRTRTLNARLLAARARFRAAMGDFRAAGHDVTTALSFAGSDAALRVQVLRAQVEVFYASGRFIKGRAALLSLSRATDDLPAEAAGDALRWLVEVVGRWEWPGLHDRLMPYLIERIEARGLTRHGVQARVERLSAAVTHVNAALTAELLDATVQHIAQSAHVAEGADLLARCAAEIVRDAVDRHYDILSGEFFPPDLDGEIDHSVTDLRAQLALPIELFDHAAELAAGAADPIGRVRVLTRILHGIIDARERLTELLERWQPHADAGPPPRRIAELEDSLQQGYFNLESVQGLVDQVLRIARPLGLHQLVADTAYEALERGLPDAVQDPERYVAIAREAYLILEDAYGLCTLSLVELRHAERLGLEPQVHVQAITELLETRGTTMTPEQRAYVRVRLGERLLLNVDQLGEAAHHMEQAVADYDQIGEVDQVQLIGRMLREVYRKRGDLGRYRALRTRFRALDARTPGADSLGLEMRIEHLLNQARREPDALRAIEIIERCIALFTRLPDGTPRVDECFVEISKICRRCADQAQTEAGFADWVRRSLDAVRTAAGINKGLGNLHRLFEEYHELFDDLLAIGALDEYRQARNEIRELAFTVGNLTELSYLFDEQLQPDPAGEWPASHLTETQAFYTALQHHMRGLGADAHAEALKAKLLKHLHALDRADLAELYA